MDSSFWPYTSHLGQSIVDIEGSQVIIFFFIVSEDNLSILAKQTMETLIKVAFHPSLHCLQSTYMYLYYLGVSGPQRVNIGFTS